MGGTSTVVSGAPAEDFWRSGAGSAKPDGVDDYTEGISHNGLLGVRLANGTPVALIDGEYGTRSGTSGRVAGQPFYLTSNTMPGLAGAASGAFGNTVGGAEVRHTNQSAGVGIAYNGLYLTGQTNLDFNFVQRGVGQYNFGFQVASGVGNTNVTTQAPVAAYNGHQHRKWIQNNLIATEVDQIDVDGASGVFYKQMRGKGGTYATAYRISPAYPAAGGGGGNGITTFAVGENTVHDQKFALYGAGNAAAFYGFGMEGAALLAMIPNSGDFFRTRRGSDRALLHQIHGNGNLTITGATAIKVGGGSWAATSDQRVKENIVDATKGLDAIRALRVRNFNYRSGAGVGTAPRTGLIAQETQSNPLIAPLVISTPAEAGSPMATTAGTTAVLGIDSSDVLWWLVKAVQEIDASAGGCETFAGLDTLDLSADRHNLAMPPGGKGYRVTVADGKKLSGLVAAPEGTCVRILNDHASKKVTLVHEGSASSTGNRLRLPKADDLDLDPYESALFTYDAFSSRWLMISSTSDH